MKISVCMATYNGEKYIKEQLESILSQIGENDEVIISDDSSTDNTVEIIKAFSDNRIKIFENQKFKYPIFNFENALNNATGDIIVLSDQDDIWKVNKIETIKKYMHNYDLVLSDATIIDEYGNLIKESFYKLNNSRMGFIQNIIKNSYLGCAMGFNRKILEKNSIPFTFTSSGLKEKKEFLTQLRKAIQYGLSQEKALYALLLEINILD